jgi:hypothetical protein
MPKRKPINLQGRQIVGAWQQRCRETSLTLQTLFTLQPLGLFASLQIGMGED